MKSFIYKFLIVVIIITTISGLILFSLYFHRFYQNGFSDNPDSWHGFIRALTSYFSLLATLFVAFVVKTFDLNKLKTDQFSEYSKMIDERDCFWKQIENAYSKIYEEKYENELNNNGYKELTQLVFSAGIPRELLIPRLFFKNINEETYTNLPKCIQYFCSFKLRTPIFFYDLKLISSRQEVTKEQWILWDFACQIYPYMESKNKNNKCLLSDEFRASRSKLSGFWERTTKQCTFKYFSQTYPKEIYSLILLTWLDITHRKTTNEKYDKGKVEMYIFAQRLMIYLKETEATLKSKYPVKENDRGS